MGIQMEQLPPYKYSLDVPSQLLTTRHELNKIIKDGIYRPFIHIAWVNPKCKLHPKMVYYLEHFMEMRDKLIIRPQYNSWQWLRALYISLG